MREATVERGLNGGSQRVYRFENGYGASVIRHSFSYGHEEGLWELAVVTFQGDGTDDFRLTYGTPITDDVLGHLDDDAIDELLDRIEALPAQSQ